MGEKKIVGLALCGSYCSYDKVFAAAGVLAEKYELIPIMSGTAAATDSRFGMAEENMRRLAELTGHADVVTTIAAAEPLGPARPMDALLIAPCTGNTLAKLAHGITDSAVTMAAKAHLRNGRPLVLAISTNDGLSGSAENRLFRPIRAGRSGEKALLTPGGFQPDVRKCGGGDGGSTASANFDCKIMASWH